MEKFFSGNEFTYYLINSEREYLRNTLIENEKDEEEKKKIRRKHNFPSIIDILSEPIDGRDLLEKNHIAENEFHLIKELLECGYGQCAKWDSYRVLDIKLAEKIHKIIMKRLDFTAECVLINDVKAYEVQEAYGILESAEKTNISFTLGGVFSYLAAKNWVRSYGDQLQSFLHVNIYKNSIMEIDTNGTHNPDYIVETKGGEWHIFESKGGGFTTRWTRLQEGLEQVGAITKVGWCENSKKTVLSHVCTFASIDAQKAIGIIVIDPEPKIDKSLIINKAICRLIEKLMAIDKYTFFSNESEPLNIKGMEGWSFVHATHFDDVEIGLPKKYFDFEKELRGNLGVYLALREILENYSYKNIMSGSEILRLLNDRLIDFSLARRPLNNLKTYEKFDFRWNEILSSFFKLLEIDVLSSLYENIDKELSDRLTHQMKSHLTQSGMLVRQKSGPGYDNDPLPPMNKRPKMKR
ncbi:hypothetical protein [Pantoea ananatis]|uniref:hypothetical protein n=2 Tax=Pantoea ananas TaxID=553 RepID=UPI000CEB7F73|nr:hypothetical protein [Pantoea ananatis]AVG78910.1 hypothetical protein B9Q16_23225 [Pantoea ananatis]PWK05770.1 hypothetical protein C7421_11249 [Pantoea ananatis]